MLSWSDRRIKDPWMAQDLPGQPSARKSSNVTPVQENYMLLDFTSTSQLVSSFGKHSLLFIYIQILIIYVQLQHAPSHTNPLTPALRSKARVCASSSAVLLDLPGS